MNSINQIYFSPTGTTQKIVQTISSHIKCEKNTDNNITHSAIVLEFTSSDLIIIGAPVYAGRIPDTMIQRMRSFQERIHPR